MSVCRDKMDLNRVWGSQVLSCRNPVDPVNQILRVHMARLKVEYFLVWRRECGVRYVCGIEEEAQDGLLI